MFSGLLIGVAFIMYNALGVVLYQDSEGNNTATAERIITLSGKHNPEDLEVDPIFIFGDFLEGLRALGGIIVDSATGGVVADALYAIPFFNADLSIILTFRFIFTFSTLCLAVNIITGRDLALFPIALAGAALFMMSGMAVPVGQEVAIF